MTKYLVIKMTKNRKIKIYIDMYKVAPLSFLTNLRKRLSATEFSGFPIQIGAVKEIYIRIVYN